MVVTGDDLDSGIKAQRLIVETDEAFLIPGRPNTKAPSINGLPCEGFDGFCIKGVQGLSLFEHHQIGDVHHSIHGVDSGTVEPLLDPLR
jgi:hypothetical protein